MKISHIAFFFPRRLLVTSLFLLLISFIIGCGGGGDNSDNGGSGSGSGSGTSSTILPEENLTVYAERRLEEKIIVPFQIYWGFTKISERPVNSEYANIHSIEGTFSYQGDFGFIGRDSLTLELSEKIGTSKYKKYYKTYNINVIEAPLEGNRDFTINSHCESQSGLFSTGGSQAQSRDMGFVDDSLNLVEKLYDNKRFIDKIPSRSRIQIDHRGYSDEGSVFHHDSFKRNIKNNFLLTCNYNAGYADLLLPIKNREEWKATRSVFNYRFDRNDLLFYVSVLSDLHSKIYKKEFEASGNSELAFSNASDFMNKTFPGSHYTVEKASDYDTHPDNSISGIYRKFDVDNKKYYRFLEYLAGEITSGNTSELNEKISQNYQRYYLSGNNECLDNFICGVFFDEFTASRTQNSNFVEGLNKWEIIKDLQGNASAKVEFLPSNKLVSMEFNSNVPAYSEIPPSIVDVYQSETLSGNNLHEYFFHFDLNNAYGGAGGFTGYAGVWSSGITGAYTCFKNISGEQLGCIVWADWTDKMDLGSDFTALFGDQFIVASSDTFFVFRFREVMRRVEPAGETFMYTTNLGDFVERHLPSLFLRRNEIHSIDYGIYATEARKNDGECYHCEARLEAFKIDLLKIK